MLKKRIVGAIIVKDDIAVQSIGFRRYLPLGSPALLTECLARWGIDEIVLLDIDASKRLKGPNIALLRSVALRCFVPLTYGGGIRNLEDARCVLENGADRLSLNSAAHLNPTVISQVANRFGKQCVVISIDCVGGKYGSYFAHNQGIVTRKSLSDLMPLYVSEGAGEFLINSIENDGLKAGYNLGMIQAALSHTSIPILAMGGAGRPEHFAQALSINGLSGVVAANYFNFIENSVTLVKRYLLKVGIQVRLEDNYSAAFNAHSAELLVDL